MRKTAILLALVVLVLFVAGCPLPLTPQTGTITVLITNASSFNGGQLRVGATTDAAVSTAVGYVNPALDGSISGGSGSAVIRDKNNDPVAFIGTGGATYRLFIMIDADNNGSSADVGVDYAYSSTYGTITVDGNSTFTCTAADFEILQ